MALPSLISARKAVEARKVGTSLVATFHRATPPLIWRFDLERNHSFTLTLQGEEGEWELGIASPRGEFHPVARFASREEAEESFNLVGDIMAAEPKPWWSAFIKGIGPGPFARAGPLGRRGVSASWSGADVLSNIGTARLTTAAAGPPPAIAPKKRRTRGRRRFPEIAAKISRCRRKSRAY